MKTAAAPLHLPLLPIEAVQHGVVNLELFQHSYSQQMWAQQSSMGLEAEVELPVCDFKDVTLVVLEGKCSLTVNEEVMILKPGMLVFIPAHTPHTLRAPADLIFLLSRCEPDPAASDSVWIVNF
jgi:mannose-6-phosphate isomerase-like protein (cupin superfamily)